MALVDPVTGTLTLRIVYDGPAISGKTTSVEWLARQFGVDLLDHGRHAGRTLFFEQMLYSGGKFGDHPIRCEVLSGPGQHALLARRRELLADADAVIFVADSRRSRMTQNLSSLVALEETLVEMGPRRPPVTLQINHRDSHEAVSVDECLAWLGHLQPSQTVESVAVDGTGIRESFVLTVGEAVRRVRRLRGTGALETLGKPTDLASLRARLERVASHDAMVSGSSPLV